MKQQPKRTIKVEVTLTLSPHLSNRDAAREVKTLINEQCNFLDRVAVLTRTDFETFPVEVKATKVTVIKEPK